MSTLPKSVKPSLRFWQIWNMSFGFLGIQFGFALQNANVSRIFETLGANVEDIPILWVAAPLTGLLVQPIVGYYSDRTWTKLGRRRPYFLAGAILASISLLIMPNSPTLWFAAGMLWMMDASINITMEPFRAFVGDNLSSSQRTLGFAMQSFFIGIGAVVASSLPYVLTNWFGIANQAAPGLIPDSVKWSFYLGGAVFLGAVLWTIFNATEYGPEQLESFTEQTEKVHIEHPPVQPAAQLRKGLLSLLIGLLLTAWLLSQSLNKELYIFSGGLILVGFLVALAGFMQKKGRTQSGFITMINDFDTTPSTMRQLAVVQFFSWFALFSMWIYMTAAVTSHIYGTTDASSKLYNDGADWVGLCMGAYNGVAALVAFAIPMVARRVGRRWTHLLCLSLGGVSLLSVYILPNPTLLLLPMLGIGIAWASILSVPYAILAGALPASKMGYYMGIFNFFIVIPQIVAATLLGFILKTFFESQPIYALIVGGVSMILAGLLTLRVKDE
jgi:maltose/moltooligosaccharide transporter